MAGDTASAVLSVIAEKVLTSAVDAIGRQFGYLFFYNRNIKNLKERVTRLEDSIKDTNFFFESQSWNNEERAHSSARWIKNAQELTKVAKKVVEDKDKLKGWCVNLKGRYVLSRKSTKISTMIRELENQAPKLDATNRTLPAAKLHGSSSNNASKDFKTRTKVMDKVMEALNNDNINIIGICGLGGIGKTTILHEVRERAIKQNIFDEVTMTTVTNDPNIFNIQSDLASMLGLISIKGEGNIIARADLLHKRLTNGNKILVVLDDVWRAIKLNDVGIPVGDDRAKCKVVLASRFISVCTSMGTLDTILVEELSDEEAWHLFKKTAGECVEKDKLEITAKKVADKCGGLPIALVTLAKALSNKNKGVWEHALTQLRQSNVTTLPSMSKEVYPSIKLSYDFLESELLEAQPFLLICCQHAEDAVIKVEKLARYCLALKLFKNVDKFVDVRNTTYAVIDHLSSCFLLQVVDVDEEEKYDTVKMHDVVRDVCLSILSEMKNERDKVYMHIMGADRNGGYELDNSRDVYSKIKILMRAPLSGSILNIHFLQHMEELRVFENSRENTDNQPPELHVLESLRMLSLERESLSEEIMSSIGSLWRLEILSFWRSEIPSFPRQICKLSNLKLLDLRCEEGEGLIPSGILLGLKKLEELCMGKFLLLGATNDKDMQNGESYGRITELVSLSNLTTLQINLVDPKDLLDLPHFWFEKLENFYLGSFRDFDFMTRSRLRSLVGKTIRLKDLVGMNWVLGSRIQCIVTTTVILELSDIKDWKDPGILEKFVRLRELSLSNCRQLEYVLLGGLLGELRKLKLTKMPRMRHVWVVPTDLMCLGNLREVEIRHCQAIESVFPHSAAKSLVQLQTLRISDCHTLGGVVSKGELGITSTRKSAEIKEESPNDFILLFPKLRKLALNNLPELGGFYNLKLEDGTEQKPLLNPLVMLPSLEKIHCTGRHKLKQLVGGGIQNLEEVSMHGNDSLHTVFDFERLHIMEDQNANVLSLTNLKSVLLFELPNLEHFCKRIPEGIQAFQNLQTVEVHNCGRLDYLISSSMAHVPVNLKTMFITGCKAMKKVIKLNEDSSSKKIVFPSLRFLHLQDTKLLSSFCSTDNQAFELPLFSPLVMLPNLESLKCWGIQRLSHIVGGGIHSFQNLAKLGVGHCDSLSYLIPSSMAHILVNLKSLLIEKCDSMEEVVKMNADVGMKKIVFSSLTRVVLKDLGQLSSFCSHDLQSIEFPSLGEVFIDNCPEMKTFCCGHLTTEKLGGVKTSYPDDKDHTLTWKAGLNETVRHLNTRVNQMKSDGEEDDVREERLNTDECIKEDANGASSSTPPEQDTPKKFSTPIYVVPPSPPVSINSEELATSSSPDLIKAALSPLIELLPSASMEKSVHSSDSQDQPKAEKELSVMPLSSRNNDWKRSRILIQSVYVQAELKTTFEEILTAKPNFLSGLRLKTKKMKSDVIESAICSLQILRQHTAPTISSEELAYVKDSLDDMEMSGLDKAWLLRGYQRAILVVKEKKVVSAEAELAMLEKKKTEDEAAFEMAREQLEASTARRDAFKAEYCALMQELEAGKELFGGDFNSETSLGDGLLD